jgi:hypothetical protein
VTLSLRGQKLGKAQYYHAEKKQLILVAPRDSETLKIKKIHGLFIERTRMDTHKKK